MRILVETGEEPTFQMAPMIDMVFLLVIFFMTASHVSSTKNLDLMIPSARSGTVPKERPARWTINITADGGLFSGQHPVTVDELRNMVAGRIEAEPETKVYLRADRATPHRDVRRVMNAMAEAGVGDFIFGVFAPQGGEGEQ